MNRTTKRALDVLLSGVGLLASAPLWALIAAAIRIDSRGPVFYGQARVGEQGRLFGSVTNQDVAAALIEQHAIEIDRRDVELDEPIRTLGEHTVTVRLGGSVQAQLRVTVVEEGRQEADEAAPATAAAEREQSAATA